VLMRWQGNSRSLKTSADGAVRDDNVKKNGRGTDAKLTAGLSRRPQTARFGMTT
jgi:hypothetical protein